MSSRKMWKYLEKKMSNEERYQILADESGHEYFVRVGQENAFDEWVASSEDDEVFYEGHDFNDSRIDGRFTFTDPRNE
jgi:hypothetical protein